MTSEQKKEFTLRISQANPTELLLIVYDIALVYTDGMIQAVRQNDDVAIRENASHIRRCINELIGALNHYQAPAAELLNLYRLCGRLLIQGELQKDIAALEKMQEAFVQIKKAFAQIASFDKREAIMGNTEQVYAGLTYGNHGLNVNVADPVGNRGFFA